MKNAITKGELKFWLAIIFTVIGGVVVFTRLEGRVNAMVEREQINKEMFFRQVEQTGEMYEMILDIHERVVRIEERLEYLTR